MFHRHRFAPFAGAEPTLKSLPTPLESVANLAYLWTKYAGELVEISAQMAALYERMTSSGFGATFSDIEGELLYVLIRETKPEVVFEISPNSGYSTNYILSAITRNGVGRLESFELEPELLGKPTIEVINNHRIPACDPSRHRINIGDARREAIKALERGIPSFTLIDSCHDDFFAEFYTKALFPYLRGIVVIQDILHFDHRPEWSSEAFYLISWLYEVSCRFLAFGNCEDALLSLPARNELTPRWPIRSSSILIDLGDEPASSDTTIMTDFFATLDGNARDEQRFRFPLTWMLGAVPCRQDTVSLNDPDSAYIRPFLTRNFNPGALRIADIVGISQEVIKPNNVIVERIVQEFDNADQMAKLFSIRAASRHDKKITRELLARWKEPTLGVDWPALTAQEALEVGDRESAERLLEELATNGADLKIGTGWRGLLIGIELAETAGMHSLADRLVGVLTDLRARRSSVLRETANRKMEQMTATILGKYPRLAK